MAYEKDAETGIVRHLDDQCIGCQYCMLKCPYDVPKYSESAGIVRKCDMCHRPARASAKRPPACRPARASAITIRIVSKCGARAPGRARDGDCCRARSIRVTPSRPRASPRGARCPANARTGRRAALRLEHAHWPLIWMLVLTQIAAGMLSASRAGACMAGSSTRAGAAGVAAFAILNLGLAVSVLHLGRPLGRLARLPRPADFLDEPRDFRLRHLRRCWPRLTAASLWDVAARLDADAASFRQPADRPRRWPSPRRSGSSAFLLGDDLCRYAPRRSGRGS